MIVPNADRAEVPADKVRLYLLATSSKEGRSKAEFFLSRGFDPLSWWRLSAALLEHVRAHPYRRSQPNPWGLKYTVDGPLPCPDSSVVNVRSIWIILHGTDHPRLVTAHPLPRLTTSGDAHG